MNAKERAKRDLDIYLARIRGFSWATIGRSFELNPRQCQRVVKEFRKGLPSVFQESALDLIDERLRMYEADISDLAEIALHARTPAQKGQGHLSEGTRRKGQQPLPIAWRLAEAWVRHAGERRAARDGDTRSASGA